MDRTNNAEGEVTVEVAPSLTGVVIVAPDRVPPTTVGRAGVSRGVAGLLCRSVVRASCKEERHVKEDGG